MCRFSLPRRSLTEGRLLRKPSAETQELEHRFEPDNLRSPSPGPREGGWLSISLTMRPPRSAPVPGLIVGLRLLRRRPLPLHIPTRSDLSGWRPLGPKGKGCPELRGGISGANKLTGFPAVQSERDTDTQLGGDSPPASLGVACMEGGEGGRRKFLRRVLRRGGTLLTSPRKGDTAGTQIPWFGPPHPAGGGAVASCHLRRPPPRPSYVRPTNLRPPGVGWGRGKRHPALAAWCARARLAWGGVVPGGGSASTVRAPRAEHAPWRRSGGAYC